MPRGDAQAPDASPCAKGMLGALAAQVLRGAQACRQHHLRRLLGASGPCMALSRPFGSIRPIRAPPCASTKANPCSMPCTPGWSGNTRSGPRPTPRRGPSTTPWAARGPCVCLPAMSACQSNNPVGNAIRPLALGRKNWLLGSPRACSRAAVLMTLIESAKLRNADPWPI